MGACVVKGERLSRAFVYAFKKLGEVKEFMSNDLLDYLFIDLDSHIEELDSLLQNEGDYERQQYHVGRIREITGKIKEGMINP
jgi:hypothetical protein